MNVDPNSRLAALPGAGAGPAFVKLGRLQEFFLRAVKNATEEEQDVRSHKRSKAFEKGKTNKADFNDWNY